MPDGSLVLSSRLDFAAAGPLYRDLGTQFAEHGDIDLDASAVERVGTACVQVILAAERHARKEGRGFRVTGMSEPWRAAFADLGFANLIASWEI